MAESSASSKLMGDKSDGGGRQTKLDHIAARGDTARRVPRAKRTAQQKEDIQNFLSTFGTPTKAWEAEE